MRLPEGRNLPFFGSEGRNGKGEEMGLSNIKNRLKKAQAGTYAGQDLGRIAELIAQGAYYDEMTEDEKTAYCNYYGTERDTLEEIAGYFQGSLHFKITAKPKPLTEAQFKERVREVNAYVEKAIEEYNSPEEKAKREAEYQELQRIGQLRKAACARGEDMSKYPLPWEKKGAEEQYKERGANGNE